MPFGLGPAPRVFTKILKPVISFLRQQGLRIVVYHDDILIIGHSKIAAKRAVTIVVDLLESLGFVIQEEKSVREPSQSLEYIGLVIDTNTMSFLPPSKKKEKLLEQCDKAYRSKTLSLKELASLLGILNWASRSVEYALAHYRKLQAMYLRQFKLALGDLSSIVTLSGESKAHLVWWIKQARFSKGRKISASPTTISICSDADWRAVSENVKTSGSWTTMDSKRHINELELLAAFNGLKCFASSAYRTTVEINVDNTTAVTFINKRVGSRSISLCSIALEISAWCEDREIDLHAVYLPGHSNFKLTQNHAGHSRRRTGSYRPRFLRKFNNCGTWKSTFSQARGTPSYRHSSVVPRCPTHGKRTRLR